jgi:hypothetical protein
MGIEIIWAVFETRGPKPVTECPKKSVVMRRLNRQRVYGDQTATLNDLSVSDSCWINIASAVLQTSATTATKFVSNRS